MIRIIFTILALVFVQLVNGQLDACQTAVLDLTTDDTCSDAILGNDTNTICEDPCRSLYDAIINNCNETVSQASYLTYNSTLKLAPCMQLFIYFIMLWISLYAD